MKKLKRLILTAMTFLLIFALFACVGGECVSHIDVDKNAKCDLCAIDVECTSCIDVDKNARCDVCGNKVACTQCVDVDQNYKCDVCGKKIVCKSCVDKNPTDAKCDLCGKSLESETNDNNSYSISGINFILPKYMKEIEVSASYADIAYGTLDDRTLEFTIYFYSKNELLSELLLDTESTVEQYANWFVAMNEYQNVERSYDEE